MGEEAPPSQSDRARAQLARSTRGLGHGFRRRESAPNRVLSRSRLRFSKDKYDPSRKERHAERSLRRGDRADSDRGRLIERVNVFQAAAALPPAIGIRPV
jgi:hypothetical protein